MARKLKTTMPGYKNRNGQIVVGKTILSGNDHNQYVYELRCPECRRSYGVNGTDIFQRKCPFHQGGQSCAFIERRSPCLTLLFYVAGRGKPDTVTVGLYKTWEHLPDKGWSQKPDFLKRRLRERYVDPIERLVPDEKNGFNIMALSCLMIETLESFYQGLGDTKNKRAENALSYSLQDNTAPFQAYSGCWAC